MDLRGILEEAEQVRLQLTFPQELEDFHGDYYVKDIIHNDESKQLVMSTIHIEYFVSLLEEVNK